MRNLEFGKVIVMKVPTYKLGPKIKDWQLFFPRTCSLDDRDKIMKRFYKFIHSRAKRLSFSENSIFILGGRVYGKEGYADGDEIFTSGLRALERVKNENHDTICAITKNGNRYYFDAYNHNRHMKLMLRDFANRKKLRDTPGYYLPYMYLSHDFL